MQSFLDAPDFGDAPHRLAELLGDRGIPESLDVFAVRGGGARPARVSAVDGSSAVIADARAFVVGAWRAAALTLPADAPAERVVTPVTARVLARGRAADAVVAALADAGVPDATVHPGLSPDACVDALRSVTELVVAREAAERLGEGDLLLLDGALQAREPGAPRRLVERLLDAAGERGVHVVGVCKSTSQTLGGLPALHVAAHAGRASGLPTWATELPRPTRGTLGRVFAGRLSAAEPWLFRFDVAVEEGVDPADVLGKVATLCGHPAYPGYPSPLAMAHHAVVMDEALQREVTLSLRRAAEDAGADAASWDLAFSDYHDLLDLGA